jgi:hypothetical protein
MAPVMDLRLRPARSDTSQAISPSGSDRDPLNFVERNLIAGSIIELSDARTFMDRHGLGVLQRAAGFKIGGDARSAEGMAADPDARAELYLDAYIEAAGIRDGGKTPLFRSASTVPLRWFKTASTTCGATHAGATHGSYLKAIKLMRALREEYS